MKPPSGSPEKPPVGSAPNVDKQILLNFNQAMQVLNTVIPPVNPDALDFMNKPDFANFAVEQAQRAAAEQPKVHDPRYSHFPVHVRNFLETPTLTRKDLEPVWVTKHVKDWDTTMADAPVTPADEVARRKAAKRERLSRDFRLKIVPELVDELPHESKPKPRLLPVTVRTDAKKEKRIDVRFDREALVDGIGTEGKPIPKVLTAFAGLRAQGKERRAKRIQSRIEKLAYDQELMHYIGSQVIDTKSYQAMDAKKFPVSEVHKAIHGNEEGYKPKKIERPHSLLTRGPGMRLAKVNRRRENVLGRAQTLANAHPVIQGKKQRFKPFFDEYDKGADGSQKRSWGERRAIGVAARKYRNNLRMADKIYDRAFRHIVTKPSRDARGLVEKRDKLTVKAAVLRRDQASSAKRKSKK